MYTFVTIDPFLRNKCVVSCKPRLNLILTGHITHIETCKLFPLLINDHDEKIKSVKKSLEGVKIEFLPIT